MTESSVSEDPKKSAPWRIIAIAVVVALVVALTAWLVTRPSDTTVAPSPSPSATSAAPSVSPAPAPTPSSAPASITTTTADTFAGCDPLDPEGFVPDTFEMDNPEADERILSLGLDDAGNIAAPPMDQPRTASWWNQGPRPGSEVGKVVMSIHTYRNGGALGNEMYSDAGSDLVPGDLIRLVGDDGRTACYEFVEAKKIWVDEYDVNSDVMVDFNGDPLLTIVICWDFEADTEFWASRILFYAKPVTV